MNTASTLGKARNRDRTAGPVRGAKALPQVGAWTPEHGLTCPVAAFAPDPDHPRILLGDALAAVQHRNHDTGFFNSL